MSRSYFPVSDHRFKKSPFFECNNREDTLYGLYNDRLYPIDSGFDEKAHYDCLKNKCCLYDVPETPLKINGPDAIPFLDKLFTRNVSKIGVGRAGYAIACNYQGGVIMDGILLRPNEEEFIYVQANGDFLNWANAHIGEYSASIRDFDSWVLQIQGKNSLQVLEAVSDISIEDFPYYAVSETEINSCPVYISRSGWTGERGFEIYTKNADLDGESLWKFLLEKGQPAGLIASDVSSMHIRRIEAGILDYGTDIDQTLNPYEIGLGRLVHFDKADYVGRKALENTERKLLRVMGVKCPDISPSRRDLLVNQSSQVLGCVSAGAWSTFLDCGIGIARFNNPIELGATIRIVSSQGEFESEVTTLPFYDQEKRLVR